MKPVILVIAIHPMVRQLLGSMVEAAGCDAVFPKDDEHPLDAISRVRPTLLLLDCDDDPACQDEGCRRAAEARCRVLLFSGLMSQREADAIARQRGLPSFALPIPYGLFREMLDDMLGGIAANHEPEESVHVVRRPRHRRTDERHAAH